MTRDELLKHLRRGSPLTVAAADLIEAQQLRIERQGDLFGRQHAAILERDAKLTAIADAIVEFCERYEFPATTCGDRPVLKLTADDIRKFIARLDGETEAT